MLRKILIISLIICFGGIVVLSFFFLKKQHVKQDFLTIKAIPINSFCVLSINDFPRFIGSTLAGNQMWTDLSTVPAIHTLQNNLHFIDSLAGNDLKKASFLNGKNMLISMHFTGNMDFDYLYTIGLETETNSDSFIDLVNKKMSAIGKLSSYQYDNTKVYTVSFDSTSTHIFYSIINNMFVASKARVLVQSSIGQIIANESLLKNKSFALVYNSSNKEKPVNIFLNYKTIPKFLSFFTSKKYYKSISQSNKLANWAELDLSLKNNDLLLNGFITTDSLSDNFLKLFSNQEPVSMNIHEVIPSNASIIVSIGFSNPELYRQTYEDCLKKDGSYDSYKKNKNELDSLCNDDVEKTFYDIIDKEMCLVLIGNTAEQLKDNAFAVLNTKSRHLAEEKIIGMLDVYSQKNGITFQTLKSQIKIDNEISYDIYRLPSSGIPKQLFGNFFLWTDANYITFYENYIIMGNSVSSLTEYIKSLVLNKTLKTDGKFKLFTENLPDTYNFLVYSKVSNSMDFYKDLLDDEYKKTLESNYDAFSKFQTIAYQLSTSKGKLYNTIYASYSQISEENSQATWECQLDSSAYSKPTFVYNFQTKENDIFVQDVKGTIYLINKMGRILWQKTIDEKIISEIFEIDFYKNGKYQYAFSTENQLFIVDRIGNMVEHFPMKLNAPSSSGLSVYDFDNNKDYRFYIPCKDKSVYCFNAEGKTIKDWHFQKSDAPITHPVKHFKINNIDYLLCTDTYTIHILNKKGEKQCTIKEKIDVSTNTEIFTDKSNSNTAQAFLLTDKTGKIKRVDLKGNVQTISVNNFSANHFFKCIDLNNDGTNDFLFVDDDKMYGYSNDTKPLFSYTFDNSISKPIQDFSSCDIPLFGVQSTVDNKIYVFTKTGTLESGFPIQGHSPFTIGYFNKQTNIKYLLVGNENNTVSNYELNSEKSKIK